ncbi:16S rRNA (guanine(527)-N(7))-methyltransferase RsmG [Desulfuromonas sp. AOP6]|uniref:16S rRNA (guanine(527)-N(7))-methyltransferase RsmG n=1 Tax=Desulfuromonas sp. AOP6 TaxID=1566351 RepID=UPI0012810B43|nr:16S rRNA (guanine(527)-N(7))-methyltransferase RsmG [Desulfuromonas sp. AOP6]BCA81209.1 ribosomal RNA small subunit methyltransferase G [Desulfuromonas sp. AOP6]
MKDVTLLKEWAQRVALTLSDQQAEALLWYLDELLEWNKKINLTAINNRLEGIEKHLIDSLTLLPLVSSAGSLLDLGSGAGLPGIPLKIVLPDLHVVMVDAIQKRILFQRHICRRLALSGIESRHGRAEDLASRGEMKGSFNVVVSRAFSDLKTFVGLAVPFLDKDGLLISMKGSEGEAEYEASSAWLREVGVSCLEIRNLELPASGSKRTLLVLKRDL